MNTHSVKIAPQYFNEVLKKSKTFEIRFNDRDYHTGDTIHLREFSDGVFTGWEIITTIGFLTDFEQKPGYVVFSLMLDKHFIYSRNIN